MTQQFEKTHCPGCRTKLEYPADYRGDTTHCPECNQSITLIPVITNPIKLIINKVLIRAGILVAMLFLMLAWNNLKPPPNHKELTKRLIHLKATIQNPHTILEVANEKADLYELYLSHSDWDSVQVDIISQIDYQLDRLLLYYNNNFPTLAHQTAKTIVVDIDLYLNGDAYKLTKEFNKAIKSGKDPVDVLKKYAD